jgi:fucose 4-O-acetylase-like acetyltransferase
MLNRVLRYAQSHLFRFLRPLVFSFKNSSAHANSACVSNLTPTRDYFFDNLKFILIVFVVLGHASYYVSGENVELFRDFVYMFHMPLFILVAGYFGKHQKYGSLFTIAYQYIVFQIIAYWLFYVYGMNISLQFFTPIRHIWFLFSLLLWNVFTPLILKLKHPFLATMLITLLFGFESNASDAINRTIIFFPFFVLGASMERKDILSPKKLGWAGLVVVIPVIALIWIFLKYKLLLHNVWCQNMEWSYYGNSYKNIYEAISLRIVLFAACFLLLPCIIFLTPERKTWFTTLGSRTLQVYLIHDFVLTLPVVRSILTTLNFEKVILYFVFIFILTVILATKPFYYLLLPFIKPTFLIKLLMNPKKILTRSSLNSV